MAPSTHLNLHNYVQAHDSLAHAPRANIRGALRDLEQYPEEHMDMGSRINGVHSSSQTTRSVRPYYYTLQWPLLCCAVATIQCATAMYP